MAVLVLTLNLKWNGLNFLGLHTGVLTTFWWQRRAGATEAPGSAHRPPRLGEAGSRAHHLGHLDTPDLTSLLRIPSEPPLPQGVLTQLG